MLVRFPLLTLAEAVIIRIWNTSQQSMYASAMSRAFWNLLRWRRSNGHSGNFFKKDYSFDVCFIE